MSAYIKLEKKLKNGVDEDVDGKAAHKNWKKLADLASKLKVQPLDTFFSVGAADMSDFGLENIGIDLPSEAWFAPADGLQTVRALLKTVQSNELWFDNPNGLTEDLLAYEKTLQAAHKAKTRFHFSFDS